MVWNLHVCLGRADVAAGLLVFDYGQTSIFLTRGDWAKWSEYSKVRIIENMNINKSCGSFITMLSLFWRISEISYLLTPYSVDKLVPFSSSKVTDWLSFMERILSFTFVHVINSCRCGNY